MRSFLLLIPLFLIFSFNSKAQEQQKRHQISGGMGVASTAQIINSFVEFLSGYSKSRLTNSHNIGEFRLSYTYRPKERWHFGGTFSYNHTDSDIYRNDEKIGDRRNAFYTLAVEAGYFYLKREKVKLYSQMGAGVSFVTNTETEINYPDNSRKNSGVLFNSHYSPIGIQYGKDWGGFAEIGFGYRGILSAGLFYNL